MADAGSIWVRLGLQDRDFKQGMTKAQSRTKALRKQVLKLGGAFAGAMGGKAILGMVDKTAKLADELGKMSKQTGVGTEALQKYRFAADKSGVSQQVVNSSLERFQKRLGMARNGSGALESQLKKMDSALLNQLKNTNNTNDAFRLYLESMGNVENKSKQAAMAQAAFGREGLKLQRMVTDGLEGIDKYGQKLEEMGGILSDDLIKASEDYMDRMANMKMAIRGVKGILTKALLPVFKDAMGALRDFAKFIQENIDAIKSWAKAIASGLAVFAGFKVLKVGISLVRGMTFAWKGLNTAMKANIIVGIASAVFMLVQRIRDAWKQSEVFRAKVKFVWESIKYYFNLAKEFMLLVGRSIWDAFKTYLGAIPDLASTTWSAIKAVFQRGKSPAEVFKQGLSGIKKDFSNIGSDAAKKFAEAIQGAEKPKYEEILDKEKASETANEVGKEMGKSMKKGIQEGSKEGARGSGGMFVSAFAGTDKLTGGTAGVSGGGGAQANELAKMRKNTQALRQEFEATQQSGVIMQNVITRAFQGMQNAISEAMSSSKNIFQAFWKFFTDFIQGLIIKLASAAIAAFVLSAVIGSLPGLGGGIIGSVGGGFGDVFGKAFGQFSGLQGMQYGGEVVKGGNIVVGETGPEMLNLNKGATVRPMGEGSGGGRLTLDVRAEMLQFALERNDELKKRTE